MAETFSLQDMYGAPVSSLSINYEFDFLGENTRLIGADTVSYPPIDDGLVERKVEDFDEGTWWSNLGRGILVTVGLAVLGAAIILTAPASVPAIITGCVAGCAIGGAVAAGVTTASVAYNDRKSGEVTSPQNFDEYLFESIKDGVIRGAISGAMFAYFGPKTLLEFIKVGIADGIIGSFVEQFLKGEEISYNEAIMEGILEGATCGLFWAGGKLLKKIVPRVSQAIDVAGRKKLLKKVNIKNFEIKNKHLSSSTAKRARKFNVSTPKEANKIVQEALKKGKVCQILDNGMGEQGQNSFYAIIDMDKVIGSKGETCIKIVYDELKNVWTVYPVPKP